MASGRVERLADLPLEIAEVLSSARRAVFTSVDGAGRPHAVPVVFAVYGDRIVTPIDKKPKTTRSLARVKNIARNPHVALLVDRWSEEWTDLAWLMIRGTASVQPANRSIHEVEAIMSRHPGYEDTLEGSDVILIGPRLILWWAWS